MYLSIGNDRAVRDSSIIGIFSSENVGIVLLTCSSSAKEETQISARYTNIVSSEILFLSVSFFMTSVLLQI